MGLSNWLKGDMGVPGEYQYQFIYLMSTFVVIVFVVFFTLISVNKKISKENKQKVLKGIAIFQLSFEVIWRLIYIFVKKDSIIWCWPMYPCNLGGILIPLIALTNWQTGKRIFYLFGFIGGVLTFLLPAGIFSSSVLTFPILKSILQHTGLLIIPMFEYASGEFRPSIKDYPYCILGCIIHAINCEGITRLLGLNGDYMFFRSGMPFVIPHVPQFITFSLFGIILLFIISFFTNYKESIATIKKLKKAKA